VPLTFLSEGYHTISHRGHESLNYIATLQYSFMARYWINWTLAKLYPPPLLVSRSGVPGTSASVWPVYQTRMMESAEQSVNDWQSKANYSGKTCPIALRPPQIPHDLTCAWTCAALVGSQRLTAWATARPELYLASTFYRTTAFHCEGWMWTYPHGVC
jgi:hypothetical protein